MVGLYKTELIRKRGPWRTADDVELATLEYLDWFNQRRLHSTVNDLPPAEFEAIWSLFAIMASASVQTVLTEARTGPQTIRPAPDTGLTTRRLGLLEAAALTTTTRT